MLDHSNDEDELIPTDERRPEVTSPVHHVWIVQISFRSYWYTPSYFHRRHLPIYSRVFEISWEIFDKEIAVKPSSKTTSTSAEMDDEADGKNTEDPKDFQTLGSSPSVKADKSLCEKKMHEGDDRST